MTSLTSSERERLLTRPFALLATAHFFQGLALHLYVHLPGFLKELGAPEVEIGSVYAITAAVAIASRPFVGRIMDRRGRRVVILAGGALHLFVCLLYLTVQARGAWVVAVRAVHGVAEAALFSSLFTLAADIVPASRRTEGIALFGVSGLLPIAVSGLLGDAVLGIASYRTLFGLSAALAAVAFAASLPVQDVRPSAAGAQESERSFWLAVLEPRLLPLWFVGTVFAICLAAVFTFMKTYVLETGNGTVGQFFAAYIVAACFVRVAFGWLPDRVGARRSLLCALSALGLGLMLLALARSRVELAAAGMLCGLGHGFAFPILGGLVVSRAVPAERGTVLAWFTAVFDLGTLIGGPLFGAMVSAFGYRTMYETAGFGCLLGTVVYAFWER
jgi:MFS family permease